MTFISQLVARCSVYRVLTLHLGKGLGFTPTLYTLKAQGPTQQATGKHKFVLCCFLALLGFFAVESMMGPRSFAETAADRKAGGPCEYKTYPGKAKITSITGRNHDEYEVKFVFTPDARIEESYLSTEGKEFLLFTDNSQYPDKEYLKKNGIKADKIFSCNMKVIIKGTCTPVLFKFPAMKPE